MPRSFKKESAAGLIPPHHHTTVDDQIRPRGNKPSGRVPENGHPARLSPVAHDRPRACYTARVCPHPGLGGTTPAGRAGAKMRGRGKWPAVMQNAGLERKPATMMEGAPFAITRPRRIRTAPAPRCRAESVTGGSQTPQGRRPASLREAIRDATRTANGSGESRAFCLNPMA